MQWMMNTLRTETEALQKVLETFSHLLRLSTINKYTQSLLTDETSSSAVAERPRDRAQSFVVR